MKLFRNASIQRKQTLIIMATTAAALLLACAAFTAYEVINFRREMVSDISTLADILDHNTFAALDFNDPKNATETLAALAAEPNIIGACIFDKDGDIFATYDRPGDNIRFHAPKNPAGGYVFHDRKLTLYRPIVEKGAPIGMLYLESDLQALYARLEKYAVIVAGVFLLTLLAAFFLSARLQGFVSEPILQLVQVTRSVAKDRNYSLRVVKRSEDELGVLTDDFNEMLAQIQERDAALQKNQDELENRVEQRTDELANSLSLLNATLESTADGILVVDSAGSISHFNERFTTMWRIPRETIGTKDDQKMLGCVVPQLKDPEQFLSRVKELYANPGQESFELLELKDGRFFERFSKPQWIGVECAGRVWSFRDVTESKHAEVTSQVFSRLGRTLMTAATPKDAARSITEAANELFGWDASAFYLYMAELDKTEPVLYVDTIEGQRVELEQPEGLTNRPSMSDRRVIEHGGELICKERPTEMESGSVPFGDCSRPSACIMRVPVRAGNRIVGIMNIQSYTPEAFEQKDLALLQTLADYCGGALERIRAEADLARERDLLRALLDNSPDCIYFKDLESRYTLCSRSLAIFFDSTPEAAVGKSNFDFLIEQHARETDEVDRNIIQTGDSVIGCVEQRTSKAGTTMWMLTTKMPLRDKAGEIIGTFGISKDITALKEAEARLKKTHEQLLTTSRMAGMAEVATSVLHNVGNVLNSVNISSSMVSDKIRNSKVVNLAKAVSLMNGHAADLPGFFAHDPKGRQLPAYLDKLATHLAQEQADIQEELASLCGNVEHIKEIVAMQQSYAKVSGIVETLNLVDLIEDALRMNAGAMDRHGVNVIREYSPVPPMPLERHKVLQILVNLIRNAKYAVDDNPIADKTVTLRVALNGNDLVRISIIDNGVGIPAENLARIFNHGFTTKKEGHGFGLHSAALAAKELGGSLNVHSDGPGNGATFIVELPLNGKK